MYQNIIFDLDDTLLECGRFYHDVKNKFVEYQHTRTSIPTHVIKNILNGIDLACTDLPDAFSKHRMPRSFAAASIVLDVIRDGVPMSVPSQRSKRIAMEVFNAEYPMFPGALELLRQYKSVGKRLFLITKGDEEVQWKKINKHYLTDVFDCNRIYVVPTKNITILTDILESHSLVLSETIYVGDSLRDDINVANAVGITSIHVKHSDVPVFEYDNVSCVPHHSVSNIQDITSIIPV